MKKNKFYFNGIRYKQEQRLSVAILLSFVTSGLIEYYRAVSLGLCIQKKTFFDVYIWNMGDPINLIFMQTILYILIISKFIVFGTEDIFFIIHKKNKREVAVENLISVIFITVVFSICCILVAFFLAFNKDMFSTGISELLQRHFTEIQNISSLKIVVGLFLNTSMYFLCLGLLYNICLYCSRKKSISYIVLFGVVVLDYAVYLCKIDANIYTFISNTLLIYNENRINVSFHMLYWIIISGVLILLSFLITIKNDVISTKQKCVYLQNIKKIIYYEFLKKSIFFILIGVIYFCLSWRYLGYSERGFGETLALFFAGSNRLDVRFLLWFFLELVVTLYVTNIVYRNQRYNVYIRAIRFKSKKGYIRHLMNITILGTFFVVLIIFFCVILLLTLLQNHIETNSRFHLYANRGYAFFLANYVLSLIVFNLFVCTINLFINNISHSYFIILLVQVINITIYNLFGGITKYLPMIHGCTYLLSMEFTWLFGLIYQVIEIILIIVFFHVKMKKKSIWAQ